MALPAGHLKSSSTGGALSSPRNSPFRRSASPVSPSTLRQSTPATSPSKAGQTNNNSRFANNGESTPIQTSENLTTREQAVQSHLDDVFGSPRGQRVAQGTTALIAPLTGHGNALSRLQPAQVRTLREGFQILDRDSDGVVNREDVADMLSQLGLASTASDISRFFLPPATQTITLATFLSHIATNLAALSSTSEIISAFSAFDDDDSGQIDLAELRDALLHIAPEPGEKSLSAAEIDHIMAAFSGKRAFGGKGKGSGAGRFGKRGEVFRYQDFVDSFAGGGDGNTEAAAGEGVE